MDAIIDTSVRNVVLYIAIIVALRLLGKKGLTQISLADIVLFLVITRAIYNDVGVEAGLVMVASLALVNYIIDYLVYKSRFFRRLIDGKPVTFIENGILLNTAIKKQRMTNEDVMRCLRQNGIEKVEDVKLGVIETDGNISIISSS